MNKQNNGNFNHGTTTDIHGNILYDAPVEIKSKEDLINYHITWEDCITIHIGGWDRRTVYIFQTPDRNLAEFLWNELNGDHKEISTEKRCLVPGKQHLMNRCHPRYSCARCPFMDVRIPVEKVSWDRMLEDAYEKEWVDDHADSPCEQMGLYRLMLDELKEKLDARDQRLMTVLRMKEMDGYSIAEIAIEIGCSEPRVYQLLKTAKKLARDILMEDC